MPDPLVVAICLVNGRPEMVRRAILSFKAQTYSERLMLLWDTGERGPNLGDKETGVYHCWPAGAGDTIGALRNAAIGSTDILKADIIMHWDSDDWSHPQRMAEQVAYLQSSGADVVGYDQMLFWKEERMVRAAAEMSAAALECGADAELIPGAAWLYTYAVHSWDYCIGTSLCYWRRTWEKHSFHDGPKFNDKGGMTDCAEDLLFQQSLKRASVSSLASFCNGHDNEPRMIASIHGGNTSSRVQPNLEEWKRAADWDAYCRERMAL